MRAIEFVSGVGTGSSGLLICTEAPEENTEGVISPESEIVEKIFKYLNVDKNDVYFTYIVKLRISADVDPTKDELVSWRPLLMSEIEDAQPKVILTLGSSAIQTLLDTTDKISKLRGNKFLMGNISIVPTYHPSYLVKRPNDEEIRKQLKNDLTLVKNLLK